MASPGGGNAPSPGGFTTFPLAPLLRALRPLQWVKNGLVFIPFLFAINLAWSPSELGQVPGIALRVIALAAAFCALSSAIYLFNDLLDRQSDRNHPVKRFRPLASGQLGVPLALGVMVVLVVAGLGAVWFLGPVIAGIGALYLLLNGAYSLGVKRVVILDVLIVASGYVIRTIAGALVIGVVPSPWLYTTTGAAALFIVLGKRYAEVRLAGESPESQRPVLRKYPEPFVGSLLNISAATALVSYALYTIEAANLPDNDAMLLTIPVVAFGLFRFLYLVHSSPQAEYPEILMSRDPPMVISIVIWLAAAGAVLLLDSAR